jgi:Ca-activated chloride channel family protein
MKFQPDDPKLTAYALGELDPSETAAAAAAVENSADCRQAVEATHETAGLLKSALQTETCPALLPAQRAVIETTLAGETVAAVCDRRHSARNQQPAVTDRRYSSGLAALLAWRPQLSTAVTWATACLIAVVGWATWLEVFCKTGRDKSQQLTGYAIKLNPKPVAPGPPPPPPPPSAANQLAIQTLIPPLPPTQLTLTNGSGVVVAYGSTNVWQFGTYNVSGRAPAIAQANSTATRGNAGRVVNWSTFNGGFDVANYPNIFTYGGGGTMPKAENTPRIGNRLTGYYIAGTPLVQMGGGNGILNFNGGTLQAAGTTDNNGATVNDGYGGVVLGAGRLSSSGPVTINGGDGITFSGGRLSVCGSSMTNLGNVVFAGGLLQITASPPNTETYARIRDNPFLAVAEQPLSTFSIDVDTASYANVRRFLMQGSLPPRDAVRIEEMVNYFSYDYAKPKRGEPFSVNIEAAGCPWNAGHRLVRVGLKGREVAAAKRPPCNMVFLLDVSGSMADANKLSLIKPAMRLLVEQLAENERVGIVVYNQSARVVLQSTSGDRKQEIIDAIESLRANGSTNGGDGLRLAYDMATRHFVERGVNRVILCTDGDFNVGTTELAELTRLIEQKRQSGVFLTVLGFGAGNLKDATLERLADKGNGHYAYVDTFFEARKVLVEQMNSTLVTIAKDVKIQVEFNPAKVAGYRLIGYEDRLLRKEDFNNDRKDAGEIGAGHTVTALYEIVPAGQLLPAPPVDPLKYQPAPKPAAPAAASEEWLTVKLHYKQPDGDKSALIEQPLTDGGKGYGAASRDFKFAAAVAAFGMVLRDSEHKGNATLAGVLELAEESRGPDASGYRTEFLSLVKKAQALGKK